MHWWPEADAEERDLPGQLADGGQRHAPVLGASRSRRDQDGVGLLRPGSPPRRWRRCGRRRATPRARPAPGPGCRRTSRSCRGRGSAHPCGRCVTEPPRSDPPGLTILTRRGNQHQDRTGRRLAQGEVGRGARARRRARRRSAVPPRPRRAGATPDRSPRASAAARRGTGCSSWSCSSSGVAIIVVNYLAHIPGVAHGSPWGLVAGLVLIFAGFLMATRYR